MGIQLMTVTAKVPAEIALFIEGTARNGFRPFRMTRSAVICGWLTWIIEESIAGRLDPVRICAQGMNEKNEKSDKSGIPPKLSRRTSTRKQEVA